MEISIIASGSSGNAYRVSDGVSTLLLDAGIPYSEIQSALHYRTSELTAVLITHSHKDHSKAAAEIAARGVCVYLSRGTADACKLIGHRLKIVEALKEITVGSFNVLPFDVQHDAPEPLGFLITSRTTREKLLYFTDTYYLKYTFRGLTHIIGECNYSPALVDRSIEEGRIPAELATRLMKSHMSIDRFEDFLRANDMSKLEEIYLVHLSENNSDPQAFKERIQRLTGVMVKIPEEVI